MISVEWRREREVCVIRMKLLIDKSITEMEYQRTGRPVAVHKWMKDRNFDPVVAPLD